MPAPPIIFDYTISVTGDCSNTNSGAISLFVTGGTPPFTIDWYYPPLSPDTQTLVPVIKTGLSAGTYSARVIDSSIPLNNEMYIDIPISSGVCISILGVQDTTCSINNGSVTGTSTSYYSSTKYYLYDINDTYIMSANTNQGSIIFGSLTAGTYYMKVEDLGGCTGQSPTFIVQNSPTLNYGLYSVPNTSCGGTPTGKIMITGLTGTPPYSYMWTTSATGSTVTGLTGGIYSVDVTDAYGCVVSKTINVDTVNPIGLGTFTAVEPTCFSADGSLTIQITGGTVPYYYSASTGDITIQYGTSWTISNLSSGNYNFQVTDAALCSIVVGTTLTPPQGITSVSVKTMGSTCSSNDGSITISVIGGTSPYTYTLIYPNGDMLNVSSNQTTQVFTNLYSGTYSVGVQDSQACYYMDEVTLIATDTFTISTETTGTTCNQSNGMINVVKTDGGLAPYTYSLDNTVNVLGTNLNEVLFTNVSSGQHTVSVTDATGCTQTSEVYVYGSEPVDFTLYTTSCGNGTDGSLTAFISSGVPPFNFNWSNNVPNNPQQIQVTGLTAGTYSLTVIDSNQCSLERNTTITCDKLYVSYQTYIMGSEVFNIQSQTKCGLVQMLNDGFNDLTNGNVGCSLISATFGVKVSVNPLGLTTSDDFFTSYSLVSAPSDNLYYDTVKALLETIPGIGTITIDSLNNQITIQTNPNDTTLNGQEIVVELTIVYDIMCLS